jgi:hypothetical protein
LKSKDESSGVFHLKSQGIDMVVSGENIRDGLSRDENLEDHKIKNEFGQLYVADLITSAPTLVTFPLHP